MKNITFVCFNNHYPIKLSQFNKHSDFFLRESQKKVCIEFIEDVSRMVGMARSLEDGGFRFDFRLAMGIPDVWIKTLKTYKNDTDWDIDKISWAISNRPCHDQSIVGDKTIGMLLHMMDKEMYTHMSVFSPKSEIVDRGMLLHMMICLLTFGLGGEAYLIFMGNEFGHPEWVDFPGISNNNSYDHCV